MTITPSLPTMKPVLTMLPPLAKEKSSFSPTTTQAPGASSRGCRR